MSIDDKIERYTVRSEELKNQIRTKVLENIRQCNEGIAECNRQLEKWVELKNQAKVICKVTHDDDMTDRVCMICDEY